MLIFYVQRLFYTSHQRQIEYLLNHLSTNISVSNDPLFLRAVTVVPVTDMKYFIK